MINDLPQEAYTGFLGYVMGELQDKGGYLEGLTGSR
jgi:hypothetical protein